MTADTETDLARQLLAQVAPACEYTEFAGEPPSCGSQADYAVHVMCHCGYRDHGLLCRAHTWDVTRREALLTCHVCECIGTWYAVLSVELL